MPAYFLRLLFIFLTLFFAGPFLFANIELQPPGLSGRPIGFLCCEVDESEKETEKEGQGKSQSAMGIDARVISVR